MKGCISLIVHALGVIMGVYGFYLLVVPPTNVWLATCLGVLSCLFYYIGRLMRKYWL